jgi:hypothetical protein
VMLRWPRMYSTNALSVMSIIYMEIKAIIFLTEKYDAYKFFWPSCLNWEIAIIICLSFRGPIIFLKSFMFLDYFYVLVLKIKKN